MHTILTGHLFFYQEKCPAKIKIYYSFIVMFSLLAIIGIFLLPKTAYLSDITSEKIIDLTNRERVDNGLNALSANQLLTKAAIEKGQAILNSQIFQHNINGKKFTEWPIEAGYDYSYIGENLAIDFETSQGVIDAWNNSPSHKKNLLSPYFKEIGVAVVEGTFEGQDSIIVVQMFGAPMIAENKINPNNNIVTVNSPTVQQLPITLAVNEPKVRSTSNVPISPLEQYITPESLPLKSEQLTLDMKQKNLILYPFVAPVYLFKNESRIFFRGENQKDYQLYNYFEQPYNTLPSSNIIILFVSLLTVTCQIGFYYLYLNKYNYSAVRFN